MGPRKKGLPLWAWILILSPVAALALGIITALASYGLRKYQANVERAQGGSEARSAAAPSDVAGVVAPMRPLPAFDGSALDVSSVMGRARKLAEAWERDATLLGVEATVLNGQVKPELDGTATVTFGPSRFASAATRTGLFVVTYDRTGIHGAPRAGRAPRTLPEPRCSPEAALARASELGAVPLRLRYALDGADRPSWLVSVASDPTQLRIFEPDACAPRGTIVVRPR